MAKGSCHGCGCELPSDCCWFCLKCVGTDTNARLIEMAISDLEQVPGGKLHNPRVLTAIGCLMSLRTLSSGVSEGTMPESTPSAKGPDLHVITTLEVVGYNETRQIDKVMDPGSDRVLYLAPVSGTTESSIDVRTSKGQIFRIPVDSDTMVAICDTGHVEG